MLQIHSSNYLESLLTRLLSDIERGDPLHADVIVVQNPGMSRWLHQQIAERTGISANIDFVTPGNFLWRTARCWVPDLPETSARNSMRLQWQIFSLLPQFLSTSAFQELGQYLQDDNSGQLRYQLAGRIANTFDQYLIYRPQMIADWQQGKAVHWQAVLWRAIVDLDPTPTWHDLRNQLFATSSTTPAASQANSQKRPTGVPACVSVFGISNMPPMYLDLMQWMAHQTRVNFYYLNPCREYWADIKDEKSQSRSQAKRRARAYSNHTEELDPSGLLDIGNPLIASWGHAGQSFLDQLLERDVEESDTFFEPESASLLGGLQRDILNLENNDNNIQVDPNDRSVQIHSAHSTMREVQVLHDQLLHLFKSQPGLSPRDVIVMAPDIDTYAPFIDATFSNVPGNQQVPWSVSDRRLSSEQQLLHAFKELLQLSQSRMTATDVIGLLEVPAVRRKLMLDRSDLQHIRKWIYESGIRWSLDNNMRKQFDLPPVDTNSWQFGLQRMFVGYAMPADSVGLFEGVAPYGEIEGTSSATLEKLQLFIDMCARWRKRLDASHLPHEWLVEADQLLDNFFDLEYGEAYAIKMLREGLLSMIEEAAVANEPVSLDVFMEAVNAVLEDTASVRQFLTGKVTFSNMVPMRSIPFKVVCVLGMNANDFPRESRPMSFDLIAKHPKRGDRSRSNDDRYLFLETVLSARQVLYLSYVGRDNRDNSEKAPATVVTELLDYANSSYSGSDGNSALSVVQHPLQPFSQRYFDSSDARLFGYKPQWFDTATAAPTLEPVAFIHADTNLEEPERSVAVQDLIDFYSDPARSYLQSRLLVGLRRTEDKLPDTELFDVSGLDKWSINQDVLTLLRHLPKEEIKQTLLARGVLPEGVGGAVAFEKSYRSATRQDIRVIRYETQQQQPIDIDLKFNGFKLSGQLIDVYQKGVCTHRFGRVRARDLLTAWIKHLLLCASGAVDTPKHTVAIFESESYHFNEVPAPLEILQRLLDTRHEGLIRPVPFFPESSHAYAKKLMESDADEFAAMKAASGKWYGADSQFGYTPESLQESFEIVWRGDRNPLDDQFRHIAQNVYHPLYSNVEIVAAEEEVDEEDELQGVVQ